MSETTPADRAKAQAIVGSRAFGEDTAAAIAQALADEREAALVLGAVSLRAIRAERRVSLGKDDVGDGLAWAAEIVDSLRSAERKPDGR